MAPWTAGIVFVWRLRTRTVVFPGAAFNQFANLIFEENTRTVVVGLFNGTCIISDRKISWCF